MHKFYIYISLKDSRYEKKLMRFVKERYGEIAHMEGGSLALSSSCALSFRKGWQEEGGAVSLEKLRCFLLLDFEPSREEEERAHLAFDEIILLSEKEGIDPYQSAVTLLQEIFKIGERYHGKLIGVYSPFGGIGKSTVSMMLCEKLCAQGRVLLIPLNPLFAWELYFPANQAKAADRQAQEKGAGLKSLCYSALAEPEALFKRRLLSGPEKTAPPQTGGGIQGAFQGAEGAEGYRYTLPDMALGDWEEMAGKGLELFTESLREYYLYTVLAFPSHLSSPLIELLEGCDERILLTEEGEEGELRLQRAFGGAMGRDSFSLCLFRGHGRTQREKASLYLPFEEKIYEWKGGKRVFLPQTSLYKGMLRIAAQWGRGS